MSNNTMTFGVDLLPYTDNTYALGLQDTDTPVNSKRWKIYASEIHGPLTGNATSATAANIASSIYGVTYYSDTAGTFASTGTGSDGYILIGKGSNSAPEWQQILPIAHGGTGITSATSKGIIYATSTTAYASTTAGSNGQVIISQGGGTANPTWYAGLTLTTVSNVYTATLGSSNNANLIVNGTTTITGATDLNGATTIGTSNSTASLTMYGNIIPELNNGNPIYTLGTTNNHWDKLYIGTTDSHGDQYTPIYWHDGKPEVTTPVQRINFTFNKDHHETLKLSDAAITNDTQVLTIVVTSGWQWIHSPITWENKLDNDNRIIELNVSAAITDDAQDQRAIAGYIQIAHTANRTVNPS